MITKDECIDRLNILNESLNDKFNDRPTKEYVKNNLNRYEEEFTQMKKDNKQKEEYAERMNNDINSELKSFDTKLASCQK